jgi:carbonic anhydrase
MISRGSFAGLIALTLVFSVAGFAFQKTKKGKSKDAGAQHAAHWTYEGSEGPNHWGQLSHDWEPCQSGQQQSPIDLTGPTGTDLANISFNYSATKADVIDNGHTIQVNFRPGNSIKVDGKRYDLLQFHFHAPSEHTINGKHSPAELHLVHKSADGQLAVVGVMLDKGARNDALAAVFKNMPAPRRKSAKLDRKINPADLLPAAGATYRYDGSLTTPPCSEGVKWYVVASPIAVSEAQLAEFERRHNHSNRPVQTIGTRKVVFDSTQ